MRNGFNAPVKTGPRKRRIGGEIAEDTTERETRAYSTLVRWRGCFQRRKASLQAAIQECAGIEGTVTDRASAVWDALSAEERLEIRKKMEMNDVGPKVHSWAVLGQRLVELLTGSMGRRFLWPMRLLCHGLRSVGWTSMSVVRDSLHILVSKKCWKDSAEDHFQYIHANDYSQ